MPPNAGPTDPIVIDETLIPATTPHWFPNWPHPVPLPTPAQARAAVSGHQGRTAHIAHFPALQLVVKFGRAARVPISEGQALWVLRQYAVGVPVPDVYGWCVDGGETFVYMQRVEGDTLTSCWPALGPEQKADVVAQLAEIISTMRRLIPKGSPYDHYADSQPKTNSG
ncbi:hypothetical protein GALMADRAFT_248093 [Galerina marginata CBS 339.88]|uniref:Aminoglycoside phosphotransferase domain-containing protein n=1 Tax=Galerina marginata (strain CBS 339.88) TaxID=685588 RepID=A0A067SZV2_GALM3|nr:hypothetical protein GALMADRAFT_248093 [Galerina marginata CBS 339.88]